jgi:hypothetical protein
VDLPRSTLESPALSHFGDVAFWDRSNVNSIAATLGEGLSLTDLSPMVCSEVQEELQGEAEPQVPLGGHFLKSSGTPIKGDRSEWREDKA